MVYKFFDENTSGDGIKNEISQTKNKLNNYTFIRKLKKKESILIFYRQYIALIDMQLISKFTKGIRFLFSVIDIFKIYAWVIPLIDKKKVLQLLMLF